MVVIKRLHIKIIASLIIGLTIFGTFGGFENNISYGSFFSHYYEGFKTINFLLSSIIIIIISLIFLKISNKIIIKILIAELCLWLLKLFLMKGGYAIGIGGPLFFMVEYDTMNLFLRMSVLILFFIINKKVHYYFIFLSIVLIYIIAHYLVMLKLYHFAQPIYIN